MLKGSIISPPLPPGRQSSTRILTPITLAYASLFIKKLKDYLYPKPRMASAIFFRIINDLSAWEKSFKGLAAQKAGLGRQRTLVSTINLKYLAYFVVKSLLYFYLVARVSLSIYSNGSLTLVDLFNESSGVSDASKLGIECAVVLFFVADYLVHLR